MQSSEKQKGFDKTVTHRDPKTGGIIRQDPYVLRVVAGSNGGKTKMFERPVGSGNMWNAQGEAIGRWIDGKFVAGEKHIQFTPPETADQKLAREVIEAKAENEALKKELAAVKAEKEKKAEKDAAVQVKK